MSFYDMNNELSEPTSIFGLRLWVVIGICVGAFIVLILFLISLCVTYLRKSTAVRTKSKTSDHRRPFAVTTPVVTKEIQEIKLNQQPSPYPTLENSVIHFAEHLPEGRKDIQIDIGKDHRIVFSDRPSSSLASGGGGESRLTDSGSMAVPGVSHLGWGHWYTLRELEIATNGLADENVIGEGGYGIVYRGILPDNTQVAVKNLLNNRGQAEREFKGEVEAIGRVRHKNLVRLLGYCVEGAYRMLVYEYIDNGNLDLWLHGDVGQFSPLTWDIRMNIILRTAKGLAYLHEGLEPKVVHRDVKSSNILLDRQWNPKVSDFGLAKLLGSERSYVTTRVMGTYGYVAPEYASTGMLTEKSDVYSFGVLIMEIISGRRPIDYTQVPGEVNLVEWLKKMVGNRRSEQVVDAKIPEHPSSRALKRALLVALRCVDPDSQKRPKMGHVIHMLEDLRIGREASCSHRNHSHDKQVMENSDRSEDEGSKNSNTQTR